MNNSAAFYEYILKEKWPSNESCAFLKCSINTIPFSVNTATDRVTQSKQASQIVAVINSSLNNPQKRLDGAWLLSVLLPQCSWDVFVENSVSWALQLLRAIQNSDDDQLTCIAAKVLGQIVKATEQFPDVSRQFSSSIAQQLASALTDAKFLTRTACLSDVFHCLCSLMERYHGPCGTAKASIEKFLLSLLDKSFPLAQLDLLASALSLLPQLGGGGVQGIAHKTNWALHMSQLIGSAQESLSELFEGRFELEPYPLRPETLALPRVVDSDPFQRFLALKQRFCNVVHCLAKCLSMPYTTVKMVPSEEISSLIVRTLLVQPKVCAGKGLEGDYLAALLPDLHMSALRLMPALAAALKSCLASETNLWWQIWAHTLQWTQPSKRSMGQERAYGKLRSVVYEVAVWCMKARSVVCVPNRWTQQLLVQALYDTCTEKDAVQLQASAHTSGPSPSKKKRGAEVTHVSSLRQKIDATANSLVCEAALKFLAVGLATSSNLLGPLQYQSIQSQVLSILEDMKRSPGTFCIPYASVPCRKGLYDVVKNLLLFSHPNVKLPLTQVLDILSHGMRDADIQVSFLCEEIMAIARVRIHPSGPSWDFSASESPSAPPKPSINTIDNGNDNEMEEDNFPVTPYSQITPEAAAKITTAVEVPVVVDIANDTYEEARRPDSTVRLHLSPDSKENSVLQLEESDEEENEDVLFEEEVLVLEGPPRASPVGAMTRREVSVKHASNQEPVPPQPESKLIQEQVESVSEEVELMLASFVDDNSSPVPTD